MTERDGGNASKSEREVRFQDDDSCNVMEEYESDEDESDTDDDASLPDLILRKDIDCDTDDEESDDEEENYRPSEKKGAAAQEVGDAYLLRKRRLDTSHTHLTKKARASGIFTMEDKHGIRN